MNVEIGLRPLSSQKKEYINGIFVSVHLVHSRHVCMAARSLLELGINHKVRTYKEYHSVHCPKTEERKFNLGVLHLYETHYIALCNVKYPYSI